MGVDPSIDITAEQYKVIMTLLNRYLPGTAAWAYGSRARWTSRPQSDLDLVVFASLDQRVRVGALRDALEESDLPFRVDLFVWNEIPKLFREKIRAEHVELIPKCMVKTPADWSEARWGDIATLEYGRAHRGYDTVQGPFRVFGTNGPIGWSKQALCEHASVIVGRKGAYRGIHYSADPFFVIDTAFYLEPKVEMDTRWAYYTLLTQDINGMDSGSAIPSTSRDEFHSLPVSVPPLSEQHAIAHILGTLDDKIELNRRMNETLEAMARALFKSWFVDFEPVRAKATDGDSGLPKPFADLFPNRLVDSEIGEIPEGWEIGPLDGIAMSPRRSIDPTDMHVGTPYIGLEHMPRRSIALTEWEGSEKITSNKSAFRKGEFLFGKLRPYFHKVGIAPVSGICSTDIVVVKPKRAANTAFVLMIISSDAFVSYTDRTSTGTRMPRTSWSTMGRYVSCWPPKSVAQAFQDLAEPMLNQIVNNIHLNRCLAELRDELLPKLVSGEIRLRDAERIVETAI